MCNRSDVYVSVNAQSDLVKCLDSNCVRAGDLAHGREQVGQAQMS